MFVTIFKRVFIRIAVLVIFLGIIFTAGALLFNHFWGTQSAPTIAKAPWIIQTSSRIYYGQEFTLLDGTIPALKGYWTLDGKRYTYHNEIKAFPQKLYGHVAIIDRKS